MTFLLNEEEERTCVCEVLQKKRDEESKEELFEGRLKRLSRRDTKL